MHHTLLPTPADETRIALAKIQLRLQPLRGGRPPGGWLW